MLHPLSECVSLHVAMLCCEPCVFISSDWPYFGAGVSVVPIVSVVPVSFAPVAIVVPALLPVSKVPAPIHA